MPALPFTRPTDIASAYSRLGQSLGGAVSGAASGFARGMELDLAQQRGERDERRLKMTEGEIARQLKDLKLGTLRVQDARILALEAIRDDKPDISEKDIKTWEGLLKSKTNSDDIWRTLSEYAADESDKRRIKKEYPKAIETGELLQSNQPIQAYGFPGSGEKNVQRNSQAEKSFLRKWAKQRIGEYAANVPEGEEPNTQNAFNYVLEGEYGQKVMADKKMQDYVKSSFLDLEGIRGRESAEKRTAQVSARQGQRTSEQGIQFANRNQLSAIDDAKVAKNPSSQVKRQADATLWGEVTSRQPRSRQQAVEIYNQLQEEQKKENEPVLKKQSAQFILGDNNGDFSENSYNKTVDKNGGNLPGIKNFAEFLEEIGEEKPVEEKKVPWWKKLTSALGKSGSTGAPGQIPKQRRPLSDFKSLNKKGL